MFGKRQRMRCKRCGRRTTIKRVRKGDYEVAQCQCCQGEHTLRGNRKGGFGAAFLVFVVFVAVLVGVIMLYLKYRPVEETGVNETVSYPLRLRSGAPVEYEVHLAGSVLQEGQMGLGVVESFDRAIFNVTYEVWYGGNGYYWDVKSCVQVAEKGVCELVAREIANLSVSVEDESILLVAGDAFVQRALLCVGWDSRVLYVNFPEFPPEPIPARMVKLVDRCVALGDIAGSVRVNYVLEKLEFEPGRIEFYVLDADRVGDSLEPSYAEDTGLEDVLTVLYD